MKQTRLREENLSVSSVHHSLLPCPSGYSSSPPFTHQSLSSVVVDYKLHLATLSHSSFNFQGSPSVTATVSDSVEAPLSKTGAVTVK